jgi:hypothetical protein
MKSFVSCFFQIRILVQILHDLYTDTKDPKEQFRNPIKAGDSVCPHYFVAWSPWLFCYACDQPTSSNQSNWQPMALLRINSPLIILQQWQPRMLYKLFSSALGTTSCAVDHLVVGLSTGTFDLRLAAVRRLALGYGVLLPTNCQETLNRNTSFGRYSLSSPTLLNRFSAECAIQIQQTFDIGTGVSWKLLPVSSLLLYVPSRLAACFCILALSHTNAAAVCRLA